MKYTYGYARVSTKEQNLDRQIISLKEFGVDERNIITDKASGKNFNREGYNTLKFSLLRSGDTLVIKELDRLGRNKQEIKDELDYLKNNKIRVKILNIPTTLVDLPEGQEWVFEMINNILIEVLGAIAEEERNKIRQRQLEGIEAAKAKGKYLGRPRIKFPKEKWELFYGQWKEGKITATEAMESLELKRNTFYKFVKEYEKEL